MQTIDIASVRKWKVVFKKYCPTSLGLSCPYCSQAVFFTLIDHGYDEALATISSISPCPNCKKRVFFWIVNPTSELEAPNCDGILYFPPDLPDPKQFEKYGLPTSSATHWQVNNQTQIQYPALIHTNCPHCAEMVSFLYDFGSYDQKNRTLSKSINCPTCDARVFIWIVNPAKAGYQTSCKGILLFAAGKSNQQETKQEDPSMSNLQNTETKTKPKVFIGSSSEAHETAEFIQSGLRRAADCIIWSQGVFTLSKSNLENLVDKVRDFDYGILILTADDLLEKRGNTNTSPRDNVIFELGLFMGALGRDKTFIVQRSKDTLSLPSDLDGIARLFIEEHSGGLEPAIGPVCLELKKAMGLTK